MALWVGITSIIGISAGIYSILIYQKSGFEYKGQVSEVVYMNDTVMELELTLDKEMSFSSGQYVFIKVFQEEIEESPHPYTIARGQGDKISKYGLGGIGITAFIAYLERRLITWIKQNNLGR